MISTAFKFIRFEKAKSTGILLGIVISIYLIGLELGMFFYLSTLVGGIINNSKPEHAQVFVVNKLTNNVNVLSPFDKRWVKQLRSIDGVDDTNALLMSNVSLRFDNGESSPAMIVGSEYPKLVAGPADHLLYQGNFDNLFRPGVVSTEFYDTKAFGYHLNLNAHFEIAGKSASIGAITKNARTFSSPILYTSEENVRYFTGLSENLIHAVIVTIKDENKIDAVIRQINQIAPDLKAWRAQDIKMKTIVTVMTANNMGMSFGTLVLFAIISGFFIIGLTMYSATYDRIKDYGTLKAIGATNRYITLLVLTQSFIFAVIGFSISLLMLMVTKYGMSKAGLLINLSFPLLLFLFLVTLFISVASSFFSVSKLKKLEPSSVFR